MDTKVFNFTPEHRVTIETHPAQCQSECNEQQGHIARKFSDFNTAQSYIVADIVRVSQPVSNYRMCDTQQVLQLDYDTLQQ